MKRSTSAALISGLVFPGAGHLYLRRYGRACIFLLPSLVSIVYLSQQVMTRASAILDKISSGALPLDPALIALQLEAPGGSDMLMSLASWVAILCWIGSIIDSFVIARQSDS